MMIVPTIQCEHKGQKYSYAGDFPKDNDFINAYKQFMFKFGYYVFVQRSDDKRVAMWIKRK